MSEAKRPARHPEGNYVAKVKEFVSSNPVRIGQVREIVVMHDDRCGIHDGLSCDCDPTVEFAEPFSNLN